MFEFIEDYIDLSNPMPLVLGAVGAAVALFTVSGGISQSVTGEAFQTPGGLAMKVVVTILGFLVGYIWGKKASE